MKRTAMAILAVTMFLCFYTETRAQRSVPVVCQVDVNSGTYYNCHQSNPMFSQPLVAPGFWSTFPITDYLWGFPNIYPGYNSPYNNYLGYPNRGYGNVWIGTRSGIGINVNINLNRSSKPRRTIWLNSCQCYVPVQ